jgi:hypothetical protein
VTQQPQYQQPQYQQSYYQQPHPPQAQPPHIAMVPPHVAQYGPAYVYPPYQAPGSQMPQYLTVPEPISDDIHWGVRLGHEIFRSIIKAFGHSVAAYFDANPLRRHMK